MFRNLEDAQLRKLVETARIRHLTRDEVLFHQGDPARAMYVVADGLIQLVAHAADGTQKVVEIVGEGGSFGEAVMLLESPCPVTTQAMTLSTVIEVSKQEIFLLLERDTQFSRRVLANMAQRLHSTIADIESLSLRTGQARVAAYLYDEHQRQLEKSDAKIPAYNTGYVALPVSKRVIASRLNLSPEALSRVLRDLTEREIIDVNRRRIFLRDITKLHSVANGNE